MTTDNSEKVTLLWADSWYDGPISGMEKYKERLFYYVMLDEVRRYALVELEESEAKYVVDYHRDFLKKGGYVGFDFRSKESIEEDLASAFEDINVPYNSSFNYMFDDLDITNRNVIGMFNTIDYILDTDA